MNKTEVSIIILMAKRIEELENGIFESDSELITSLAAQIAELTDENFNLRKDMKHQDILLREKETEISCLREDKRKALEWKQALNHYREKYENMHEGYMAAMADFKRNKENDND